MQKLKAATRGRRLSEALFAELLEELQLPEATLAELKPHTGALHRSCQGPDRKSFAR